MVCLRIQKNRTTVKITLLLADRYTYEAINFSPNAKPSHPVDINVTLSKMAKALEKGSFNTLQIGTGEVGVKRMKACADLFCEAFSFEVVAPSPSASLSAGSKITSFKGITVCLTSIILLLRPYVVGIDI